MNLSRRASILLKSAALWAGVGVAALCIALAGVGFLMAGLFILLARYTSNAEAACLTGVALLLLAVITMVAGGLVLKRIKKRQPSMLSEFGGTIGMAGRLVGMMVRRDPKKAMILSIVAGALAEYITSSNERRDR